MGLARMSWPCSVMGGSIWIYGGVGLRSVGAFAGLRFRSEPSDGFAYEGSMKLNFYRNISYL